MKPDLLSMSVWLLLMSSFCFAQSPAAPWRCSNDFPPPHGEDPVSAGGRNFCFDVDYVAENCTPVWLRTQLHFFLEDDCSGTIDPLNQADLSGDQAYVKAEALVLAANAALADNNPQWNQVEWGVPESEEAACIPYRYLLTGVSVHCDSEAKATSGEPFHLNNYFQPNFGVAPATHYNVYLVDNHVASGAASAFGGNAFATEELHSTALFNHEFGHCLNLFHSWGFDFVEDTPPISWIYDVNCDGDVSDFFPATNFNEDGANQCWLFFHDLNIPAPPSIDFDGDGVVDISDPCSVEEPCTEHPCCDWSNINNNVMAYTTYAECCGAFTQGQALRALSYLSTPDACSYIEEIGSDCPPPAANIGLLPDEGEQEDCLFCLHFEASVHDDYFRAEFYEVAESELIPMHHTGFVPGPASTFCIGRSYRPPFEYNNGFEPGKEYRVRLTVTNVCGDEATDEITFWLPEIACSEEQTGDEAPFSFKSIYPNPMTSYLTVGYDVQEAGDLELWFVSLLNQEDAQAIRLQADVAPGSYQDVLQLGSLPAGLYSIVANFNGRLITQTLIKN